MVGPLTGIKVVELAGIGPGPHAAMLLADHGAEVVRVERPTAKRTLDASNRGRRVVEADLKNPADLALIRDLIDSADVLLEGFRPGVMERLGLGPEKVARSNPSLIYGRMTGWGQTGPEAHTAGHDLAYIARTGVASLIGPDTTAAPVPPLNLVGDFGGGSMFLVFGVLAALYEREQTGKGQIIDAAIIDGTAVLSQMFWARHSLGAFRDVRGQNMLDGSAPFYAVYRCSDDRFMAVSAVERPFFDIVTDTLGLPGWPEAIRLDRSRWAELRAMLAEKFAQHPQSHWISVFDGTDACTAPVRSMSEAPNDSQMKAREVFVEVDGITQPRPAPRFSNHGLQDPQPTARLPEPLANVVESWNTTQAV